MAILIGHASIDEHGHTAGGTAGDQTQCEVCTRTWFDKDWKYVLRPISPHKAELMAAACLAGCRNDQIGYDQKQRETLRNYAKRVHYDLSLIDNPCETDCSAFMTVCAEAAGIKIHRHLFRSPSTHTMKDEFLRSGEFMMLTDSKYLTDDLYLKRGDILVSPGHHTIMALENGSCAE